jgi:glyoxylase-like metal-dependent hydrolase (beta-lactamase superfamily II)
VGSWIRNIVAFIALLLGFFIWSFTPSKLFVPPDKPLTIPQANPPAGMSIAAIPAGEMRDRAIFAFRGGRWSEQRTFSMAGLLVRHPRGTLLFDTGFGSHVDQHVASLDFIIRSTTHYQKGPTVAQQLKAAGIELAKLQAIVLTHAHWDHVSGLPDLPGVPVWVTEPELAYIHGNSNASELARSLRDVKYTKLEFSKTPYLGFKQSRDVYGDGSVVIVPAGGHTPGSIIAFISLPSGAKYALVGDLVWQKEGIELPAERPWPVRLIVDYDSARVRDLILQMRQIAHAMPSLIVVPAHDARVWRGLPRL